MVRETIFVSVFPLECLRHPDKLFISEKLAHILFGQEDPVGKEIIYNHQPLVVGGVYENFPRNSFLMYTNALHSLAGVSEEQKSAREDYSGYIRISPNANPQEVKQKIQAIIDRHTTSEQPEQYALHPLKELHLKYGCGYNSVVHTRRLKKSA